MLNTILNNNKNRSGESGNVLFLILIAVALFAALSYAVTQSSRSGGGAANGESNLVNSAQVTQYPASVRTAIVRMLIGGVDVTQLNFDAPSAFATTCDTLSAPCVFHPSGGGATLVTAPAAVSSSGAQRPWIFTSDYRIDNIGTTANDIIAMFPGISSAVCQRLNEELGILPADGTPLGDDTGSDVDEIAIGPSTLPTTANNMDSTAGLGIGTAANASFTITNNFSGQPFGCFDQDDTVTGNELVYYHVLVER